VRDFLIRIIFAAIGPLLGWITDNISLESAFFLSGGLYLISAAIMVFPWISKNEK
jgi:hypothetical protein